MDNIKVKKVYEDLRRGLNAKRKLIKEMRKDAEFALGKQWDDEDKQRLERRGVKALTINKIKPMIKLITGIERQGRTDYKAFPEGQEDELVADIATRLIKNVSKVSRVHNKISDQFKEGMTVGECYIEPYIDYTFDLINGDLKFRKINGANIIADPGGEEYDLSDRKFMIKITKNLSREDLEELFPKQKDKIDKIGNGKIDLDSVVDDDKVQTRDYQTAGDEDLNQSGDLLEASYDLLEYYYKKMIDVHYIASPSQGIIATTEEKEEAEQLAERIADERGIGDLKIITKQTPEIRIKQIVGKQEFLDDRAWTFPRWRSYPFIPFIAEWMTMDVDNDELLIQGMVRGLRDLQLEYNKRRTQELHHLNASQNSGTLAPKGALDRQTKDKLKKQGSSPGFFGEYDPGKAAGTTPNQWKILPQPLSQGHAQLAQENAQDIREGSGVNPELLANESQSQSGRAILLKQRQGIVMIQEALDNYTHTKELLGRFILSQLGEVYTVETAIRVLGQSFINDNFKRPKFDEQGEPVIGSDGNIETELDPDEAGIIVNKILNDAGLGKYDVSIGEGPFNETIKFTNFMTLMELVEKGVPIPPDVIIEESGLSESQKKRIIESIEKQRQAQLQSQGQEGQG